MAGTDRFHMEMNRCRVAWFATGVFYFAGCVRKYPENKTANPFNGFAVINDLPKNDGLSRFLPMFRNGGQMDGYLLLDKEFFLV